MATVTDTRTGDSGRAANGLEAPGYSAVVRRCSVAAFSEAGFASLQNYVLAV